MSLAESRYAIIESLTDMDREQAQQVLDYIQSILKTEAEQEEKDYERFKENALREINLALREKV